jgi:hypothetical protein
MQQSMSTGAYYLTAFDTIPVVQPTTLPPAYGLTAKLSFPYE